MNQEKAIKKEFKENVKNAKKYSKKFKENSVVIINPVDGTSKWFSESALNTDDYSFYLKQGYTEKMKFNEKGKFYLE